MYKYGYKIQRTLLALLVGFIVGVILHGADIIATLTGG